MHRQATQTVDVNAHNSNKKIGLIKHESGLIRSSCLEKENYGYQVKKESFNQLGCRKTE
jgi:hypothetical protein